MKATSFSLVVLPILLAAVPAAADSQKKAAKPARGPTAMHTSVVHSKTTSAPQHAVAAVPAHHAHTSAAAPAPAHAAHPAKPKPPCLHEPITIARGIEEEHVALTKCDGTPLPDAVDRFSILARPESAHKPIAPIAELVKVRGVNVSPGVRRVDPKLLERLQLVADHFGNGHPVTMRLISGYRPTSAGSYHATAQAIDFRVDGVRNEELVSFCRTLQDTGCGYYPNSSFIHLDVRQAGTGPVSWIDASGPGEGAHYVSAWPPPPEPAKESFMDRLSKIFPELPVDAHPATAEREHDAQPTQAN